MKHLRPLEFKDETPNVEEAIASLTNAFNTKMTALDSTVKSVETKAADALKPLVERLDKIEAKQGRPATGADEKKEADAIETKAFETFIRRGKEALTADEVKSLRVSDDTAGGYLAPDSFHAELDRNIVLYSPVRSVARVLPTGAPAVLWPKRTGGMTAQ